MGKILPGYKYSILEDIFNSLNSEISYYYGYASNPIALTGNVQSVSLDDKSAQFNTDWLMLFGKRINAQNVVAVIDAKFWQANTVYDRYDNTKDLTGKNFYVIGQPAAPGQSYDIFKCIDNAGGNPSTVKPDLTQVPSFTKSDGYTWRYITSIVDADWKEFASGSYAPVYGNTTIQSEAAQNSGVEVVVISNSGIGYSAYTDGVIQSVLDASTLQIANSASADNNFYQKNGIYIYNTGSPIAEIKTISTYIANSTGKWVYLDSEANTNNIIPGQTFYKISPRVVFETDGDTDPVAYTTINALSNSINSIVIVENGTNISWANVYIQSNTIYGSGANVYAIVPPPGGHGARPEYELQSKGYSIAFSFVGDESGAIPDNVSYNRIGILKYPTKIDPLTGAKDPTFFTANAFSTLLKADTGSAVTFDVGEQVVGQTSKARGIVAFSNSSTVYLAGDKTFANSEYIVSSNTNQTTQIIINTLGDVYTKDLAPIYVQNIVDVTRSPGQTEKYKLIVEI